MIYNLSLQGADINGPWVPFFVFESQITHHDHSVPICRFASHDFSQPQSDQLR